MITAGRGSDKHEEPRRIKKENMRITNESRVRIKEG